MYSYERQKQVKDDLDAKIGYLSTPYGLDSKLSDQMEVGERVQFAIHADGFPRRFLIVTNRQLFFANEHDLEDVFPLYDLRLVEYQSKIIGKNTGVLTIETTDNRRQVLERLAKHQGQQIADFLETLRRRQLMPFAAPR